MVGTHRGGRSSHIMRVRRFGAGAWSAKREPRREGFATKRRYANAARPERADVRCRNEPRVARAPIRIRCQSNSHISMNFVHAVPRPPQAESAPTEPSPRAMEGPKIIKGPILSDRAPRTFGVGDAGFPAWGPHQAPQRPNHPYEDVTSTEARQRLVNGSPPFRGNHLREDPTSPDLRAARAREVRARRTVRWKRYNIV